MKTLNKTQLILPLLAIMVAILVLSTNHFFPFYTYVARTSFQSIRSQKIFWLPIAIAIIICFLVPIYRRSTGASVQAYYSFFDDNPIPMTIACFHTNKFLAANKAAIDLYGYSHKEFLKLAIKDIRIKEEPELVYDGFKTDNCGLKKTGIRQHRKKSGEIILVEASSGEIIFKNKKCRLLLALNIVDLEKAKEEKRIAQEEKIRQKTFTSYVIENLPVDVAIFDKDHKYVLLNKNAVKDEAMRKWMIGKDDFDYFALKGRGLDIAEKRRERFLNAIAGESEEWIDEHLVDGKLKYMLRKFYPYKEDGELKYVYGYGIDITEVKKAEQQRDEYIAQLEKIAFATSHNLRPPICNLQGLVSILEMEEFQNQDVRNVINCMRDSVTVMDQFTRDLGIKLHEYRQNLSKDQKS